MLCTAHYIEYIWNTAVHLHYVLLLWYSIHIGLKHALYTPHSAHCVDTCFTCATYVRTATFSFKWHAKQLPCARINNKLKCANCKQQVTAPATDLRLTYASCCECQCKVFVLVLILLLSLLYVYDMVCTSPRRLLSDYQIGDYYLIVVLSVSRGRRAYTCA